MKRIIFILALVGAMPLSLVAQEDDMYYVPGKSQKSDIVKAPEESEQPTYYCGSDRDVDEYNRRGRVKSYYQKIGSDSLGNDIIEFHEGDGTYGTSEMSDTVYVYPGSEQYYDDSDFDYAYSRCLGRFDGFYGWYDPYFSFYWRGPYWWGYNYYWYDPWFYGYYSPWYWHGWYSPYYYGWNGWYGWRPSYYYSYSRPTSTTNHSTGAWHSSGRRNSGFSGYRGSLSSTSGSFGNRNNSTSRPNSNTNNRYTFGGQRRTTNTNTVSRPASRPQTSSPSINRGSFGGSRGGGSFGGGSFGGGGRSGGGSFGGRR